MADKCSRNKEDEEVQCCVEIKCGSHTCRNNVESNPCAEGAYVANFRYVPPLHGSSVCSCFSPKRTNDDYLIVIEPSALPLPLKAMSNAASRTPTAGLNAGTIRTVAATMGTLVRNPLATTSIASIWPQQRAPFPMLSPPRRASQ